MIRTCDILRDIEEVSWSASTMAEMGKATLKEMDRVYNEVASERRRQGNFSSAADAEDQLGAETVAPRVEHGKSRLSQQLHCHID
jgi:hypothetical protein